MRIKFTRFHNEAGLLCKKFRQVEGKLVKEQEPALYEGKFYTEQIYWSDFPQYLQTLTLHDAISNVVCKRTNGNGRPLAEGNITTRLKEKTVKDAIARSVENFVLHSETCTEVDGNLFYIDIDDMARLGLGDLDDLIPPPGLDDNALQQWLEVTQSAIVAKIFNDLPELAKLSSGCVSYPSAGALIFDNKGNCLRGLTGVHIYFILPLNWTLDDVKTYIQTTLWAKGHGYFKTSRAATLLERTYIDTTVLSRNRLDFISGAATAQNLTQRRGKPIFFEPAGAGEPNFYISDEQLEQAEANKLAARNSKETKESLAEAVQKAVSTIMQRDNVSRAAAERTLEKMQRMVLPGSVVLYFDDGTQVEAWKVKLDPQTYHLKTCADPFRPDKGRCKCQIYYNSDGSLILHSFVHGGYTMNIEYDFPSISRMIEAMDDVTLTEKLGSDWMKIMSTNEISKTERTQLFDALKRIRKARGDSIGLGEIKERFDAATEDDTQHELEDVLRELNEKYAILFQGGKPRLIYEKQVPWVGDQKHWILEHMPVSQLHLKCNKYKVYQWKKGVPKRVDVAGAWLEWPNRRDYEGVTFRPDIKTKDVRIGDSWFFNIFRGYGCKETKPSDRPCKGEACGGKGCVDWFFNQDGYKTVKSEEYKDWTCGVEEPIGLLWWLRSAYENLAMFEIDLCRWIVDWVANLIQSPADRPGTALITIGGQGTGKGLFIKPIGQIMQEHFVHVNNLRDLVGRFNAHLECALLVYADEATYGGDKETAGVLKTLVTEDMFLIEKKGVDKYSVQNHLRLYGSSNNDWVIPADLDERRYCIVRTWEGRKQNKDYFARVAKCEGGDLLWDMRHWTVASDLRTVPVTEELKAQKRQNLTIEQEFLYMFGEWLFDDMPGDAEEEQRVRDTVMQGGRGRFRTLYDLARLWLHGTRDLAYLRPRAFSQRIMRYFEECPGGAVFHRSRAQEDNTIQRAWMVADPKLFGRQLMKALGE